MIFKFELLDAEVSKSAVRAKTGITATVRSKDPSFLCDCDSYGTLFEWDRTGFHFLFLLLSS